MSHLYYTGHIVDAWKVCWMNAEKYYKISAEHPEIFSNGNNHKKLMEKKVMKWGRINEWKGEKSRFSWDLAGRESLLPPSGRPRSPSILSMELPGTELPLLTQASLASSKAGPC